MSSRFAGMAPDNVEIGEALGFPLIESNPSDVEETRALTSCCIQSKKVLQHTALSYHTVLEQRPLLVKSISALFILGSADLVGQGIQALRDEGTGSLDVLRTVRFAVFGFVLQAPWNHFYYLALDGALPPTEYPWTKRTFVKVVIDQFLQAPIFTALMFLFLGLLEAKSMEAIGTQLQDDYWHTMIENWKLWVPATIVNLGLIPPLYRVLYLNIVFFFWSIILSLILHPAHKDGG